MLEGQVAVLSSGMLTGTQSLAVLRSLRASPMYRADQHSYMLYPDRELPGFLHKNCLSADQIRRSALVTTLLEQCDQSLIIQDQQGVYHFNGSFRNAKDVRATLALLRRKDCYTALVDAEAERIVDLFDTTFAHRSFTGRSGKFFAYEGLGSIYWHMVAKLLLAVQETYWRLPQVMRRRRYRRSLQHTTIFARDLGLTNLQIFTAHSQPTHTHTHQPGAARSSRV